MTALTLPGLDTRTWQKRHRNDRAARALADRHYSRQTVGAAGFAPPGRLIVLVTPCEQAAWVTHWPQPDLALDGLDAWRCTLFRNEGAGLSSTLIRAAMSATTELWGNRPPDGWVTWIDTNKVRSTNPGYCYLKAGWHRDVWRSRKSPNLVRLRA